MIYLRWKDLLMTKELILIYISALPIILILLYVYNQDKEKEPIFLLLQLFGLGMISCFIVLAISNSLEKFLPFMKYQTDANFIETFLYSFLGVAIVEEGCKWTMLFTRGYFHKEFDEIYDIIVYSVFVSLGFAFLENLIYILLIGNIQVAIIRAISAVPGHACNAIFMGYYLSYAKQFHVQKNNKQETNYILLSILMPTILHGIYDFCLLLNSSLFIYIFLIFISSLFVISIKKLKQVANNNKKMLEQEKNEMIYYYQKLPSQEWLVFLYTFIL